MTSTLNKYLTTDQVRRVYRSIKSQSPYTLSHELTVSLAYDKNSKKKLDKVTTLKRFRKLLVMIKGDDIHLYLPMRDYRNTTEFRVISIPAKGEPTYKHMYWGSVKAKLHQYDTAYAVSGDISYMYSYGAVPRIFVQAKQTPTVYSWVLRTDEGLQVMNQLRARLSMLVRRSNLFDKAKEIAVKRINNHEFSNAEEICVWLWTVTQAEHMDQYLYKAVDTSVSSKWDNGGPYDKLAKKVRYQQFIENDPNGVLRKYAKLAYTLYKDSFNKSVYGELMSKLSKE